MLPCPASFFAVFVEPESYIDWENLASDQNLKGWQFRWPSVSYTLTPSSDGRLRFESCVIRFCFKHFPRLGNKYYLITLPPHPRPQSASLGDTAKERGRKASQSHRANLLHFLYSLSSETYSWLCITEVPRMFEFSHNGPFLSYPALQSPPADFATKTLWPLQLGRRWVGFDQGCQGSLVLIKRSL